MAYDIFETSDGAGYNQFNDLNFDAWTASGDDEHIFVTGTRPTIYSFDELRAILDQLPAEDGLTDIRTGGIGGEIADIPFDAVSRILEIFRITDDRTDAAERDQESTFDRDNENLLDVWIENPDGSVIQWWFDTSNNDWWTDTNGEGTPDLRVRNIGGGWWADLDFDGTFERQIG